MGIIFLVFLGAGVGGAAMYWAHGVKVPDGALGKPVKWVQDALDERRKDRGV